MDLELRGKTALVTGASRGIGKAIARELAREGANVAMTARNAGPLEAAAAELKLEVGGNIVPITGDVGDDDSVRVMVDRALAAFGSVDILVNNAMPAYPYGAPVAPGEITPADFVEHLNVKVLGSIRCARALAPHMCRQGWGRIINIGGLHARTSGLPTISVRNAALVALTKNLADELGPHGVNVIAVHPGLTLTEDRQKYIDGEAVRLGVPAKELEQRMAQANSTRRAFSPAEVAYVVVFLSSPRALAINGDVIAAGGGVGSAIYY